MKFRKKGKQFIIEKSKNELYKIIKRDNYFSLNIYKKPQWVSGITSMCADMKHIVMIDWDNVCRWIVEKELEILSKERQAPFYLFKTKEEKKGKELVGNYHAICLVKYHPFEIIYKIIADTSCDNAYRTMPLRNIYRSWVLRISDKKGSNKPKFVKVIYNVLDRMKEPVLQEISSAHLKVLKELYPEIPNIKYVNKDNLKKIFINHYETG